MSKNKELESILQRINKLQSDLSAANKQVEKVVEPDAQAKWKELAESLQEDLQHFHQLAAQLGGSEHETIFHAITRHLEEAKKSLVLGLTFAITATGGATLLAHEMPMLIDQMTVIEEHISTFKQAMKGQVEKTTSKTDTSDEPLPEALRLKKLQARNEMDSQLEQGIYVYLQGRDPSLAQRWVSLEKKNDPDSIKTFMTLLANKTSTSSKPSFAVNKVVPPPAVFVVEPKKPEGE